MYLNAVSVCAIILFILIESTHSKSVSPSLSRNRRFHTNNNENNLRAASSQKSKCGCRNFQFHDPTSKQLTRNGRVINGNVASAGDFPWQVLVQKYNGNSQKWEIQCGGVLIGEKFVVTAQHCLGLEKEELRVVVGIVNTNEINSKNIFEIDQIIEYESRPSVQYEHDIVLLKLRSNEPNQNEGGVACNENIQPICLDGGPTFKAGTQCFLSGWGNTEAGGTSTALLYASIPLQSRTTCNGIINDRNKISFDRFTKYMICAGVAPNPKFQDGSLGYSSGKNRNPDVPDSCSGDSGGPLACIDEKTNVAYLTGLVSFGVKRCGGGPSVYVKMSEYAGWLNKEMATWA